ncbi:flagellum-specific peptidoglycan hydrolase FlgJ [Saonia flava]|uniref:Peptidoglycan hydrolase n=1 Tax=Saonia flava TaxID=523696 RepID=A0A846QY57_9FLAO|nr:glucosaminidase domain-containing protein [Saonia flava]NJB72868.1 flagellum-specific peptidoglycan hydrolase FlgJ [Saonia flava]
MIKRIIAFIIFGALLTSCGAKKKSVYGDDLRTNHKTHENTTVSVESNEENPLPDFGDKFIKFNISSVEEYINTFADLAQSEMRAYGIPASITLAQGILESGSGKGELARKTNNHFGIKCHKGWVGEYELHDDDEAGECFRKYVHPMLSFRDHSEFLSSRSRYAFLFEFKNDDYKRWAKGLREAGYATDKRYPQKLIALIERYQLYKYDNKTIDSGDIVQIAPKTYDYTTHVVEKGDTLYSISRKYYISVPEIMKLNKMTSSLLSIGQELRVKTEKAKK